MRLPSVFASFACQRSLVCCRPPWRVFLTEPEAEAFRARDPSTTEPLASGQRLMAQRGNACVWLAEGPPGACRLQSEGGLAALPLQCRNFPRSVVGTPAGGEAAFLLDCPTALGCVVDGPAPFAWVEAEPEWPYPQVRLVGARLPWEGARSVSFDTLQQLREGWWRRLADPAGEALTGTLGALARHPDDPSADAPPRLERSEGEAELLQSMLERLPGGRRYGARRADFASALARLSDVRALSATPRPDLFGCATAVLVQVAGVHEDAPVADGLRTAAGVVMLAMTLALALDEVFEVSPGTASRDAFTVALYLHRVQRSSRLVMEG